MDFQVQIPSFNSIRTKSVYPKATNILNKFKKAQVRDSKRGLAKAKLKDTSTLNRSVRGIVKKFAFRGSGGRFTGGTTMPSLDFKYLMYGEFHDKGVKGSKSSQNAPTSPYKYRGGGKTIKQQPIRQWLQRKGLPTSLTYIISKRIYERGLKTTNWWSTPFRKNYSKYMHQYHKAIADDIATNVGNQLIKQLKTK